MNFKDYESEGLIEKIEKSYDQIHSNLQRALKDLKSARGEGDEGWAYVKAYNSMLRAGRTLLFSKGYRPKGPNQHKTVVELSSFILGERYKKLTMAFDRMRRKRHNFIYEPDRPISKTEALNSIQNAEKLVKEIIKIIKKENPQYEFKF